MQVSRMVKSKYIFAIGGILVLLMSGFQAKDWFKKKFENFQKVALLKKFIGSFDLGGVALEEKGRIVAIFTPDDCDICLDEIPVLVDFTDRRDIKFQGIIPYTFPALAKRYLEDRNWDFEVFYTDQPFLINLLQDFRTPIKVLMDRDNNIIYIEGANNNWQIEGSIMAMCESLLPKGQK